MFRHLRRRMQLLCAQPVSFRTNVVRCSLELLWASSELCKQQRRRVFWLISAAPQLIAPFPTCYCVKAFNVPGLVEDCLLQPSPELNRQERVVVQEISDAAVRQEINLIQCYNTTSSGG